MFLAFGRRAALARGWLPSAQPPRGWGLARTADFRGRAGRVGCAGDAASTPPGPGPAAGGCAFGRLRSSASPAKRPHPCKLVGAIHGACAPAQPTRPATDRFLRAPATKDKRKIQRQKTVAALPSTHGRSRRSRSTPCVDVSIRYRDKSRVRARCEATGSDPVPFRQIAEICRRRGGSGCGGVSRMDAATEPYLMEIWQRRCREPAWAAV